MPRGGAGRAVGRSGWWAAEFRPTSFRGGRGGAKIVRPTGATRADRGPGAGLDGPSRRRVAARRDASPAGAPNHVTPPARTFPIGDPGDDSRNVAPRFPRPLDRAPAGRRAPGVVRPGGRRRRPGEAGEGQAEGRAERPDRPRPDRLRRAGHLRDEERPEGQGRQGRRPVRPRRRPARQGRRGRRRGGWQGRGDPEVQRLPRVGRPRRPRRRDRRDRRPLACPRRRSPP